MKNKTSTSDRLSITSVTSFRLVALATLVLAAPIASAAGECGDGKVLFSCTSKRAQKVLVCDAGETIVYSVLNKDAEPSVISVPRADATTDKPNGFNYAVRLHKKDMTYVFFWAAETSSGVQVYTRQFELAKITCDTSLTVVNGMKDLDLALTK